MKTRAELEREWKEAKRIDLRQHRRLDILFQALLDLKEQVEEIRETQLLAETDPLC